MNYAIAFLGLIFVFAAVYWVISGRKFYHGPLVEADIAVDSSRGQRESLSVEDIRNDGDHKSTLESTA